MRIMMMTRTRALLTLLAFGCPAAAVQAQLAPSPDASPVSNAPAPAPEEETGPTLKIQVNLVDVFFTVTGKGGELVPHLTTGDCSVSEELPGGNQSAPYARLCTRHQL